MRLYQKKKVSEEDEVRIVIGINIAKVFIQNIDVLYDLTESTPTKIFKK